MNKSEQIQELALALSNLQGELEDAHKSKQGYGYNYADLSSVLGLLRPLLRKHGLSIAQPVSGDAGSVSITTMLLHSSGQHISSTVTINIDVSNKKMNSLQAAGSTITYLRRYSLMSLIGLAATDDDGKAGGEHLDASRDDLKKSVMDCVLAGTFSQENMQAALAHYKVKGIDDLSAQQLQAILTRINKG